MADIVPISVNLPVLSTAILPDALPVGSGQSTGMNLPLILENIERLLKVRKRKADAVSRAAGVPDAIRNLRRAVEGKIKSSPTLRIIDAIARELGTDADSLMREKIGVQPAPGMRDAILRQLEWLDQERERAMAQLEALDEAERVAAAPRKRKIR